MEAGCRYVPPRSRPVYQRLRSAFAVRAHAVRHQCRYASARAVRRAWCAPLVNHVGARSLVARWCRACSTPRYAMFVPRVLARPGEPRAGIRRCRTNHCRYVGKMNGIRGHGSADRYSPITSDATSPSRRSLFMSDVASRRRSGPASAIDADMVRSGERPECRSAELRPQPPNLQRLPEKACGAGVRGIGLRRVRRQEAAQRQRRIARYARSRPAPGIVECGGEQIRMRSGAGESPWRCASSRNPGGVTDGNSCKISPTPTPCPPRDMTSFTTPA